jgi:hypothetical protein
VKGYRVVTDFASQFDPDPDNASPDPGPVDTALPINERDYILPAQDSKGHHARLYCRTIPATARMVSDVHASRKYPFRTVGDLVRWCVDFGVRRLAAGKGINTVTAHADTLIAMYQDEEFQLQFLEVFTYGQKIVNTYLEAGAAGEARRVVALTRAQIEAMPDGYWKDRYREELLKRYRSLLDAPGVVAGTFDVDAIEA